MDDVTRNKMGAQAVSLARSCGYYSTGTVEFLMDKNKDFYFLEMNTRLQVEHPITEEITGVDLVEQQLLIAAGYPLAFKQEDVKIHGHSFEYRVYAEDPQRKFLPSIGFLKKYKEPTAHEHIRIDTGVQEGSEISMYYDPMISKLITWGKDRKTAMDLLATAMEEYVIRGVTHNVGFGSSILRNESFIKGEYSTAFIPTFYPEGFKGDPLNADDHHQLILSAFYFKNLQQHYNRFEGQQAQPKQNELYLTLKTHDNEQDYKITSPSEGKFEVTNLKDNKTVSLTADNFELDKGAILRFSQGKEKKLVQFVDSKD